MAKRVATARRATRLLWRLPSRSLVSSASSRRVGGWCCCCPPLKAWRSSPRTRRGARRSCSRSSMASRTSASSCRATDGRRLPTPMRLFFAIELSDALLDLLDQETAALRAEAPELSWTTKEKRHLTLKFLGDVREEATP